LRKSVHTGAATRFSPGEARYGEVKKGPVSINEWWNRKLADEKVQKAATAQ
jgi:hypothetical protein